MPLEGLKSLSPEEWANINAEHPIRGTSGRKRGIGLNSAEKSLADDALRGWGSILSYSDSREAFNRIRKFRRYGQGNLRIIVVDDDSFAIGPKSE